MTKTDIEALMRPRLTEKQKRVIFLLMSGEVIVNDERWFYVSEKKVQHKIDWRTWDILTKRHPYIRQQTSWPFHYVLTDNADIFKQDYLQYINNQNKK